MTAPQVGSRVQGREWLEMHEHCYITGPLANGPRYKFSHSHEGGSEPHEHPHTGPGALTIDKDEWFRATGMRGGGRKKFTAKATGVQLPLVAREVSTCRVVIVGSGRGDIPEDRGAGPGLAPAVRMALTFGMRIDVEHVPDPDGQRRAVSR